MRAIKHHALTMVLLNAVAAGTWAYEPGVARAEGDWGDMGCDNCDSLLSVGSGLTVVSTLVFVVADAAYGAQREWLPPGWAAGQLLLGALPNLGMGAAWASLNDTSAVLHYVFATWFLTHGILSLVLYEPTDDDEGLERPWPNASVYIGMAPVDGGAIGSLVGRF
jgi:hypothetical protein